MVVNEQALKVEVAPQFVCEIKGQAPARRSP